MVLVSSGLLTKYSLFGGIRLASTHSGVGMCRILVELLRK